MTFPFHAPKPGTLGFRRSPAATPELLPCPLGAINIRHPHLEIKAKAPPPAIAVPRPVKIIHHPTVTFLLQLGLMNCYTGLMWKLWLLQSSKASNASKSELWCGSNGCNLEAQSCLVSAKSWSDFPCVKSWQIVAIHMGSIWITVLGASFCSTGCVTNLGVSVKYLFFQAYIPPSKYSRWFYRDGFNGFFRYLKGTHKNRQKWWTQVDFPTKKVDFPGWKLHFRKLPCNSSALPSDAGGLDGNFSRAQAPATKKKVQQDLSQPGCKAWNKRKCTDIGYGSFWDGWIHESNLPGYGLEESYVRSLVRSQWDSLRFCRGQNRRLPPPTKRRPLSWTRLAKDGGLHSVDTFGSLPDP